MWVCQVSQTNNHTNWENNLNLNFFLEFAEKCEEIEDNNKLNNWLFFINIFE